MAAEQVDNASMEVNNNNQNTTDIKHGDVVSVDLPAPEGWTKKFVPKKDGTPRRNEIVFTAPTGEEIKTKRQLEQYLKARVGGPSASEFDWGSGDTPRRSSRIRSKPRSTPTTEIGSSRKKQKRSNSKEAEKKQGTDGEGEVTADTTEAKKDAKGDGKADEAHIADIPAEASAGETKPHEGEPEKVVVEAAHETAAEIKEDEADGKVFCNPSEVGLTDSVVAVEVQSAEMKDAEAPAGETKPKEGELENNVVEAAHETAAEIKEENEEPAEEMLAAQVQPEAPMVTTVQSVDEMLAAAEGKDLEKAVSSEEITPANAGNGAPEAGAAPAIIC